MDEPVEKEKKGMGLPISPADPKKAFVFQEEMIQKAEVSRVRSFAFERRQRLPYLIEKGLAKPGSISFDILRRAATSVHIARICINTLKEKISKTKWVIQPIDPMSKVDEARIKQIEELFKHPNKNNETFRSLLDKILEDLLVLDAVAIEKLRDVNTGELLEIHYVDASTIRPVYDEHGNQDVMIPLKNEDGEVNEVPVSYVQVLDSNPYGGREAGQLVAAWPKKDFMYFCMHPQGSMGSFGYGLSPLEAVIGVVGNILNADNFNGTYFEEGAFPPMIIQMKQNMDVRELQALREYMYNELEGRFHRPAIIGGEADMDVKSLKEITQRDMQFMDYMMFMSRLLAAAYGLSGQDIGLTEDIGSKNVAETQKDLSQAKGYGSILHLLKEVFNQEIIWKDFGFTDIEFDWVAPDTTDPQVLNASIDARLKNGTITLNEARKMFGEEPFGDWADTPMILSGDGFVPVVKQDKKEDAGKDKIVGGEKNYGDQAEKELKKSIQTKDGRYEVYIDDRGVSQPFIFVDILSGEGRVIKPPVAVNLDSQKLEEEWTHRLNKEGLNVVPVTRISAEDVFDKVLPTPELKRAFVAYQNMEPEFDSKKWTATYGHSRKFSYYTVSKFIDGRNLKDKLLIEDMKRVPNDYMKAVEDLAALWLAEKKYIMGDRRADQYIVTPGKRAVGFDYQFVGNKSRWDGTKNALLNALSQIPVLQKKFKELTGQDKTLTKSLKKFLRR
ncbi:MAG: phage portal protein [Nitrospiria bacterium]